MGEFWAHVGISGSQVISVAVSAGVLYLVYAAVMRLWGQRIRSSTSTLSLALTALTGSLIARSMLGDAPTLTGGLVALATLIGLEAVFGVLRQRLPAPKKHRRRAPTVILVDGLVLHAALSATRLSERDLTARLRQMGILSYADLALVVLEDRGGLSVVRAGERIDRAFLADVRGAASLPDSIVRQQVEG